MLVNKKVRGMTANDPIKFIKSPTNGKAAPRNIFPAKRKDRRQNRRKMFCLEAILSFSFRNLVSSVS